MITLDANIYISAFQFKGKPALLIKMAGEGKIDVAISEPILNEVLRTLREKFSWSAQELRKAETLVRAFAHLVTPTQMIVAVPDDPDDNRVLECAVASGSECIVTGDKDLLRLGGYAAIRILTVADFLERAQGRSL